MTPDPDPDPAVPPPEGPASSEGPAQPAGLTRREHDSVTTTWR